jgi:hypothetical protein
MEMFGFMTAWARNTQKACFYLQFVFVYDFLLILFHIRHRIRTWDRRAKQHQFDHSLWFQRDFVLLTNILLSGFLCGRISFCVHDPPCSVARCARDVSAEPSALLLQRPLGLLRHCAHRPLLPLQPGISEHIWR